MLNIFQEELIIEAHYICAKNSNQARVAPRCGEGFENKTNWIHRIQIGHLKKKFFFSRWLNIFEGYVQKIRLKLKNRYIENRKLKNRIASSQ